MKYSIVLIVCFFIAFLGVKAQNQSTLKTDTLGVQGVCEMCKERIESAAKNNAGVVAASWDIDKQLLTVVYQSNKVSLADIQKSISESGHNTTGLDADETSFQKLPYCCRKKGVHSDTITD